MVLDLPDIASRKSGINPYETRFPSRRHVLRRFTQTRRPSARNHCMRLRHSLAPSLTASGWVSLAPNSPAVRQTPARVAASPAPGPTSRLRRVLVTDLFVTRRRRPGSVQAASRTASRRREKASQRAPTGLRCACARAWGWSASGSAEFSLAARRAPAHASPNFDLGNGPPDPRAVGKNFHQAVRPTRSGQRASHLV